MKLAENSRIENWATETAAAMVDPATIEHEKLGEIDWPALRLRVAIALVQARALECRQISASIIIKQLKPGQLAYGLGERGKLLEELGLVMAGVSVLETQGENDS
jgi:hypothetical protein